MYSTAKLEKVFIGSCRNRGLLTHLVQPSFEDHLLPFVHALMEGFKVSGRSLEVLNDLIKPSGRSFTVSRVAHVVSFIGFKI